MKLVNTTRKLETGGKSGTTVISLEARPDVAVMRLIQRWNEAGSKEDGMMLLLDLADLVELRDAINAAISDLERIQAQDGEEERHGE